MQNRSIFPYRRHGPKKRVKHGPNKARGPQKGLPNSARDLLPMLQPATKALAQVLAGRAGASGQLGHARTMLAQAERLIAERAHNRLAPAEREEFFEQLARLKLTLADADAEAEVQAEEQEVVRPPVPPVARERLKEMALALSMPQRPEPQPDSAVANPAETTSSAGQAASQAQTSAHEEDDAPRHEDSQPSEPAGRSVGGSVGDRLVLPKARADQVAQAVAYGGIARRRSRAASRGSAPATGGADQPAAPVEHADSAHPPEQADTARPRTGARIKVGMRPALGAQPTLEDDRETALAAEAARPADPVRPPARLKAIPRDDDAQHSNGAVAENGATDEDGADPDDGAGPKARAASRAKTTRRTTRKPKHRGLPEGWVIDEEGFVVPAAD